MFRKIFLLAAVSGMLVSAPGVAQSTEDVRCLLLSNAFASSGNSPQAKKAGQTGALFYLGRVDGRWNDAQLRSALAQQQVALAQQQKAAGANKAGPELQACIRRVEASYKKLQSLSPSPTRKP